MKFHSFSTPTFISYEEHEKVCKNPLDMLFSRLGLKKLGLDHLSEYCTRYAKNLPEVKPWQPHSIPEDAFLLDFHAHTSLSDGEGTFKTALQHLSKTKSINGIAFTNHPWNLDLDGKTRIRNEKVVLQSYTARDIVEKMKSKGQLPENFLTFEGSCEFAPRGTYDFPRKGVELIGIGLPRTFIADCGGLTRIRKMYAEQLVEAIHNAGGLAILPHPFYFCPSGLSRELWNSVDAVESFNQTTHVFCEPVMKKFVKQVSFTIPLIDQIFALQLLFAYFAWRNRIELARSPRPVVGCSDAHILPFLGSACTMYPEPVEDLEDLMKKLNKGKPMLNPRWERTANHDEIINKVWRHWGKDIVKTAIKINTNQRFLLPLLKIITKTFSKLDKNHATRS